MANLNHGSDESILNRFRRGEIQYFNLSIEDHRILSMDAKVIEYVGNDLFSAFEDQIAEEDRDVFFASIQQSNEEQTSEWIPVHLKRQDKKDVFFIHFEEIVNAQYLRFAIVHPAEVLNEVTERRELTQALFGVISLFEDICFMAKPEADKVYILQGDGLHFTKAQYTMDEFEDVLTHASSNKSESGRSGITEFMSHLRHGSAVFENKVDGDFLERGNGTKNTLLKAQTKIDAGGELVVYGIIHAMRERGSGDGGSMTLDYLTGALQKEDITKLAIRQINERQEPDTNLAIIDIDYFKSVNDTYGHKQGDEVLQKVAGAIRTEVGSDGILGRFGGDEFIVLFRPGVTLETLRAHFSAIKNSVRTLFPTLSPKGDGPLTVSIGSACFPSDGTNFDDIFMVADYCLYLAKEKGRNRFIIYTPEKHPSIEEIRSRKMNAPKLPARENTTLADTIINLLYDAEYGGNTSFRDMLDEFSNHLNVSAVGLFAGSPYQMVYSRFLKGEPISIDADRISKLLVGKYLGEKRDFIAVNQLSSLPESLAEAREYLESIDAKSFLMVRFTDAASQPAVLILLSIHEKKQWNQLHFRYYQLFCDALKRCELIEQ